MLTLYDYLPSQNAYKVRVLLNQLAIPYRSEIVEIFLGQGRSETYLAINPAGAVPAIRFDDGRTLAESNAILRHLAEDTPYLPADRFARAKVDQWLSFEQNHVESVIGSLRHWVMTGKLARRAPELVEAKRNASMRTLAILDRELAARPYIVGDRYSIADLSIFAYASRADEAGLPLANFVHVIAWIARVRAEPRFLDEIHPYSIDPASAGELP